MESSSKPTQIYLKPESITEIISWANKLDIFFKDIYLPYTFNPSSLTKNILSLWCIDFKTLLGLGTTWSSGGQKCLSVR